MKKTLLEQLQKLTKRRRKTKPIISFKIKRTGIKVTNTTIHSILKIGEKYYVQTGPPENPDSTIELASIEYCSIQKK